MPTAEVALESAEQVHDGLQLKRNVCGLHGMGTAQLPWRG